MGSYLFQKKKMFNLKIIADPDPTLRIEKVHLSKPTPPSDLPLESGSAGFEAEVKILLKP